MPDLISGQPQEADNAVLASQANELLDAPAAAPDTTGTETKPEQTPDINPKYQGKSVAELARMHTELESKLGEQGREVGELRNQVSQSLWQLQQAQNQLQNQQRPKAPEPEPPSTANFWDNPISSVDSRVDSRLEKRLGEVMGQMARQQAMNVGELAFDAARSKRPDLFEGIEPQVHQFVQQGIGQGWLAPDSAGKPETYMQAAWQMQGIKNGFTRTPSPVNAVQPSFSETPSAAKPQDSGQPIAFSDEARRMIRGMGYKDEDIAKEMRERSRGQR
jgi:hypothetical protein